jgi:formylmethanofuran dehydrogenase subunit D
MIIKFHKIVGKTIAKGQITVPKEYDPYLDDCKYCPIGNSVDITYQKCPTVFFIKAYNLLKA